LNKCFINSSANEEDQTYDYGSHLHMAAILNMVASLILHSCKGGKGVKLRIISTETIQIIFGSFIGHFIVYSENGSSHGRLRDKVLTLGGHLENEAAILDVITINSSANEEDHVS